MAVKESPRPPDVHNAVRADAPPHAPPGALRSFRIAATVILLWIATLIALVVFSANPTTLNRAQLSAAPFVIQATRMHGTDQWQVSRSWPDGQVEDSVEVEGLAQLPVIDGQSYLIPVEPVEAGRYRLVPTPEPLSELFIYPADPQSIAELSQLRADRD